jgi:hypothetical protein
MGPKTGTVLRLGPQGSTARGGFCFDWSREAVGYQRHDAGGTLLDVLLLGRLQPCLALKARVSVVTTISLWKQVGFLDRSGLSLTRVDSLY